MEARSAGRASVHGFGVVAERGKIPGEVGERDNRNRADVHRTALGELVDVQGERSVAPEVWVENTTTAQPVSVGRKSPGRSTQINSTRCLHERRRL